MRVPLRGQFRGEMRRILKTVPIAPTLLTIGNLSCGFAALVYIAKAYGVAPSVASEADKLHYFALACWCVLFAMVFDALDGTVARLTKTMSEFGKQMDSLADVVSFGVAPAFIVKVMTSYFFRDEVYFSFGTTVAHNAISFLTGMFVVCAALRLARYNVECESKDKYGFDGLPSPGAAGAAVTMALLAIEIKSVYPQSGVFAEIIIKILPFYMLLLGGLMVSRVKYPHLIKLYFRGKRTLWHIFIVILIAAVQILYPAIMLAISFNLFVLLGLTRELFFTFKKPAEGTLGAGNDTTSNESPRENSGEKR